MGKRTGPRGAASEASRASANAGSSLQSVQCRLRQGCGPSQRVLFSSRVRAQVRACDGQAGAAQIGGFLRGASAKFVLSRIREVP